MPYTKNPDWEDVPSTDTLVTAAKLNHMEAGIEEAAQAASETVAGNVELATAAEMTTGTDTARVPSVKRVADYVAAVATGIPASIVDAKGDLLAGTAADTVARVAVGTNGYLLKADSSAPAGVAWVNQAAVTETLTGKTIDGASNTILGIETADVNGLDAALSTIPNETGLPREVYWDGSWPNRSASGTSDPDVRVIWVGGTTPPAISGTGATGAIGSTTAGVIKDRWVPDA